MGWSHVLFTKKKLQSPPPRGRYKLLAHSQRLILGEQKNSDVSQAKAVKVWKRTAMSSAALCWLGSISSTLPKMSVYVLLFFCYFILRPHSKATLLDCTYRDIFHHYILQLQLAPGLLHLFFSFSIFTFLYFYVYLSKSSTLNYHIKHPFQMTKISLVQVKRQQLNLC